MAAQIIIHRDDIIKEGWISKESVHLKTWRRRWLILTPQYLCTFKSEGEYRNPTEVIRLRECSSVKSTNEDTCKENSLRVASQSRDFCLIADNEEEKEAWVGHIGRQMMRPTAMIEDDDYEQ